MKIPCCLTKGLKFDVQPSRFAEDLDKSAFSHPSEYVLENAKQKALEVARRVDPVSDSAGYEFGHEKNSSE